MHLRVNGVRLFFDVEGAGLVPDGPAMRDEPALLLLHGASSGIMEITNLQMALNTPIHLKGAF
jgi:hypothetical protein